MCAAKFDDDQWYRAKVEKVLPDSRAAIFYVDYGNRQTAAFSALAALPSAFQSPAPYASEYGVALAKLPTDAESKSSALKAFYDDVSGAGEVDVNIEYRLEKLPCVTIMGEGKEDLVKGLISDGLLLAEPRREHRFKKMVSDYKEAEEKARKEHLNLWQYGDIREDDANEFGFAPRR